MERCKANPAKQNDDHDPNGNTLGLAASPVIVLLWEGRQSLGIGRPAPCGSRTFRFNGDIRPVGERCATRQERSCGVPGFQPLLRPNYSRLGSSDTISPEEDRPTVQMIFCPLANRVR
jgi:hypothetical protein